jgi:hypothetical protein
MVDKQLKFLDRDKGSGREEGKDNKYKTNQR